MRSIIRRRTGRAFALAGLCFVASLAASAPASATVTIEEFPVSGGRAPNPCAGEDVELSGGAFRTKTIRTPNAGGGFTFSVQVDWKGVTGVGLVSGNAYRLIDLQFFRFNTTPGGTLAMTTLSNFHVVSKGATPNWRFHATTHFTATPDGELSISFDNFAFGCPGDPNVFPS
jgi:hypothetical protein